MTRIVQVANFVTPTSGGLRTTLRHLSAGYADAGHEVVQILPGDHDLVEHDDTATRVWLSAPSLPGTGYRVHRDVARVRRVLDRAAPDVLEVHDRTTLRGLGQWARRNGVRSSVISHERLDRWLRQWLPTQLPLRQFADRSNDALVASYDVVLCTTEWAAEEFVRLDADNLRVIPLGVDAATFIPRIAPWEHEEVQLVMTSRLSKEKRPELAIATVQELTRRRMPVRLVVCGDGPMRKSLARESRDLPIEWRGFVEDRAELASLIARSDVALAPGPIETFGLGALESLACGTPVVVNRNSALPAIVGDAGRSVPSSGWCFADAVQELLTVDEVWRRSLARRRAELFDWNTTVQGFLAAHQLRTEAKAA